MCVCLREDIMKNMATTNYLWFLLKVIQCGAAFFNFIFYIVCILHAKEQ